MQSLFEIALVNNIRDGEISGKLLKLIRLLPGLGVRLFRKMLFHKGSVDFDETICFNTPACVYQLAFSWKREFCVLF